jgi:hypothetical protein
MRFFCIESSLFMAIADSSCCFMGFIKVTMRCKVRELSRQLDTAA